MKSPDFKKGEYVVYGDNGIFIIKDIKEMQASADTPSRLYFVFKSVCASSATTLYVPADNPELRSKIRYVLNKEEIDLVLSDSKSREIQWVEDKNVRNMYFRDILRSGAQENLLPMIRCIYLKKQELNSVSKKLPIADDNALKRAERIVTEEFSYSLDIPPEDVGEYIRSALEIEAEA